MFFPSAALIDAVVSGHDGLYWHCQHYAWARYQLFWMKPCSMERPLPGARSKRPVKRKSKGNDVQG